METGALGSYDEADMPLNTISLDRPVTSYAQVQRIVSFFLRNRRFQAMGSARFEYMNVGCGPFPKEGFCNVDFNWSPGILCLDITRGIPLPPSSLRGIFTEHCLEHISYAQCLEILRDFRRMLKPGGVARIVVPDGELYCSLYMQAQVGKTVVWPYAEDGKLPIYYVNRIMHDHGHKFIYDFDALKESLLVAGFREVRRESFRRGSDPKLLIDQEHRSVESLYVEGIA
jgi:predicted SAM-dependent methyltransferase